MVMADFMWEYQETSDEVADVLLTPVTFTIPLASLYRHFITYNLVTDKDLVFLRVNKRITYVKVGQNW
jgi:hypothetical protein